MKTVETAQGVCRFAVAQTDITPPVGIYHRMWGAATHDRSVGVHRPLTASVLMFASADEGKSPQQYQLLVALDHCLFSTVELNALLDAITAATAVAREAIVVTFSHTHAAGMMTLDRQSLPGGDLIPEYLSGLYTTVAKLAVECQHNLRPADITYGRGHCHLAAHRDFWDEVHREYVCGLNPGGPADDAVLVARITVDDGQVLATVVNYACHPTTLAWQNRLISPDFPGATCELVRKATGAPCVFIQGACGDLGPREGYVGEPEIADRNGRQLGYAALSVIESLPPPKTHTQYAGPVVSGATIGTWENVPLPEVRRKQVRIWDVQRATIDLPYRPDLPSLEQVARGLEKWQAEEKAALATGDQVLIRDCRAMVERQTRLLARLGKLPTGNFFPYKLVVWRIGDGIWISVQGEPYNLLQTSLRQRFPGVPIMVASISSDWGCTYLPPAELYGKGIYQESIAVLAPGSLEKVIESAGDLIEQIIRAPASVTA